MVHYLYIFVEKIKNSSMTKIYNSEQKRRISILLKKLSGNKRATRKEIIEAYTDKNLIAIERSQFGRDINLLKEKGVSILCEKNQYFIEGEIPKSIFIDMDEKEKFTLPILFNLVNLQKEVDSVIWLKDELETKYGILEDDWQDDTYFSSTIPHWKDEIHVIPLAIDIIKRMKNEEVITFEYKPVNTYLNNEVVIMAPLQIRLYDGRYYLFGVEYKNGAYDKKKLRLIEIDQIRGWKVSQIQVEGIEKNFDYTDLYNSMDVKRYFYNCLGVVIPDNNKEAVSIKIKFCDWAKSYVKNKKIHHSQIPIEETHDYIIVQICVYETYEVDFLLGRFREYAERLDNPNGLMTYNEYCRMIKKQN